MSKKSKDILEQTQQALNDSLTNMRDAKNYIGTNFGSYVQSSIDSMGLVARIMTHCEEMIINTNTVLIPIVRHDTADLDSLYVSNAAERILETTDNFSVDKLKRRLVGTSVNGPNGVGTHFETWIGTIYSRIQSLIQMVMEWLDKIRRNKRN